MAWSHNMSSGSCNNGMLHCSDTGERHSCINMQLETSRAVQMHCMRSGAQHDVTAEKDGMDGMDASDSRSQSDFMHLRKKALASSGAAATGAAPLSLPSPTRATAAPPLPGGSGPCPAAMKGGLGPLAGAGAGAGPPGGAASSRSAPRSLAQACLTIHCAINPLARKA
jgi:hypothetical protein